MALDFWQSASSVHGGGRWSKPRARRVDSCGCNLIPSQSGKGTGLPVEARRQRRRYLNGDLSNQDENCVQPLRLICILDQSCDNARDKYGCFSFVYR